MKKFLVIGNPINHSLSPKLHNYWLKENNIKALYDREKLDDNDLENLIGRIRNKKLNGINVTVPFKKKIISHLDNLTYEAENTQSVNTVYLKDEKIIGHNTDIYGFESAIKGVGYNIKKKNALILGAGGVVPSIIFALYNMKVAKIIITNRTKKNAENLKKLFRDLVIVNWGETVNFDLVINATSIGLKIDEELNLDFLKTSKDKFFYDVTYNPKETNFLKLAKKGGNKVENGKKMFIYQAAEAFKIWHGTYPMIGEELDKFLDL